MKHFDSEVASNKVMLATENFWPFLNNPQLSAAKQEVRNCKSLFIAGDEETGLESEIG